ncbi:hypothetical protein [Brytella acorum]|uniref:Uncharacterized protein n=1 Tax=Brytella acorum TaxID=2959299 RepID=A0AA35USQ5_9PROT|nr:hypothetical protein [Brytella acorum]CAI9121486.1 hypothetical protein LMG32879_002333 [Brytella acorum]
MFDQHRGDLDNMAVSLPGHYFDSALNDVEKTVQIRREHIRTALIRIVRE